MGKHMTTLPESVPTITDAPLPRRYEMAKTALAECERIDECKDWSDKRHSPSLRKAA